MRSIGSILLGIMEKDVNPVCPFCTSKNVVPSYVVLDHEGGESFDLQRCSICALIWVSNPPSAEELGQYYTSLMGQSMRRKPSSFFAQLRSIRLKADVRPFSKILQPGDKVLDFGTGDGSLALELVNANYKVEARDMYPTSEWTNSEIRYDSVNVGSPRKADFFIEETPADAVIMRHVLEHSPDPVFLLNTIRDAGVKHVIAIVPNAGSFLANRFKSHWYYWDPPRHLFHFERQTLEVLANATGGRIGSLRKYGIDEILSSINRAIRVRSLRKGKTPSGLLLNLTHPTGVVAGLMSAVTGVMSKGVIRVRIDFQ